MFLSLTRQKSRALNQRSVRQINLLDNIKEDAQRTGYQQGHEKGQQEGYQAGFEQGLRAGEEQGREQALALQQPVIETWQNCCLNSIILSIPLIRW